MGVSPAGPWGRAPPAGPWGRGPPPAIGGPWLAGEGRSIFVRVMRLFPGMLSGEQGALRRQVVCCTVVGASVRLRPRRGLVGMPLRHGS